jgi:hypothetical protein
VSGNARSLGVWQRQSPHRSAMGILIAANHSEFGCLATLAYCRQSLGVWVSGNARSLGVWQRGVWVSGNASGNAEFGCLATRSLGVWQRTSLAGPRRHRPVPGCHHRAAWVRQACRGSGRQRHVSGPEAREGVVLIFSYTPVTRPIPPDSNDRGDVASLNNLRGGAPMNPREFTHP